MFPKKKSVDEPRYDALVALAAVRRAQLEKLRPLSNSDLPLMDLSSIHTATNSFSKENKLGEGGFGPVYRVINITLVC
jgi:hypothetical protein